jgi:hypothetical protein
LSFTLDEVGIERGAVKAVFAKNVRIMNRFQDQGPERADTRSITGSSIGVEYLQDTDEREIRIRSEVLTEAIASTVRDLLNGTGPATLKPTAGDATEYEVLFTSDFTLDPVIGHYTNGAPSGIRWWSFEARLLRLT